MYCTKCSSARQKEREQAGCRRAASQREVRGVRGACTSRLQGHPDHTPPSPDAAGVQLLLNKRGRADYMYDLPASGSSSIEALTSTAYV